MARTKSPKNAASIGGKARAQKLSPERRHEIAMKAARASMEKAGKSWENRKRRPTTAGALEQKHQEILKEVEAAEKLLLDPVAWIEHYLINPETGKPFVLYPEQKQFLREAFTPDPITLKLKYDEVIFSAPKKRGKTTTGSIALLYIIAALGDDRAEGYVASNSREQSADRVFADCDAIVKASPALNQVANVRNDAIEFPDKQAFIKTVTTEASSAAGGRPTIIVFDELWGFQSKKAHRLWDELVTTPTTRISVRFTVTYAGFTGESELLEGLYRQIFDEEHEIQEGVTQLGKDLYAKGRMLVYWSHDVRPPWVTDEWIETQRRSYSPAQFARIMENRWVSSESTFIEGSSYDMCVDKALEPVRRAPHLRVWTAIDASVKKDSTAIVTVALDSQETSENKSLLDEIRAAKYPHANPLIEMMAALPWKEDFDDTKPPPTLADLRVKVIDHKIIVPNHSVIDFTQIENYVIGLTRRFHVELVAFDPYQMVAVAQGLSRFGVPMYELTQTQAHAVAFTEVLRDLITQMRLRVYPAEDLRQHVLNAAAKENERGARLIKRSKSARIDAAVALAMACYACARSFSMADPGPSEPVGDVFAV